MLPCLMQAQLAFSDMGIPVMISVLQVPAPGVGQPTTAPWSRRGLHPREIHDVLFLKHYLLP